MNTNIMEFQRPQEILKTISQKEKIKNAIHTLAKDLNEGATMKRSLIKVLLFGSCARDEIQATSDVDICLVCEALNDTDKFEIYKFFSSYFEHICNLDLVWCTEDVFLNGEYIFESIRKEGIVLYEKLL